MPNPFMRSVQQNTSDESMTPDRPHPTAPILETYEGTNHPYRGVEQHGVSDTGDPSDPVREFSDGTRKVIYEEPPKEIDPVPVRIVQEGSQELRTLRTWQYSLSAGQVARVIPANPNRTKVRIKNLAAFAVYIGGDPAVAAFTGYPLNQNETLELDTQDEVYVLNPDLVLNANVAFVDQFSLPV